MADIDVTDIKAALSEGIRTLDEAPSDFENEEMEEDLWFVIEVLELIEGECLTKAKQCKKILQKMNAIKDKSGLSPTNLEKLYNATDELEQSNEDFDRKFSNVLSAARQNRFW